jgi:hypothetical protein
VHLLETIQPGWSPHSQQRSSLRARQRRDLNDKRAGRYYSEMLSAGLMDNETATALMVFRETHGGTLSGMTRYTDHL